MATRGRRRPQRANSAQGAGRPRITTPSQNRKKGRGWHTNREGGRSVLVSHLAISCRDPNRFEPAMATRGGCRTQHANSAQGAGRPRITTRGGCRPQPESSQRRKTGSQAVFRTDEYLTLGWIQPRDKPVSGFDRMDPCLTPGYPPPYINRLPFIVIEDDVAALPW